jgi:hypothetical protein
MNETMSLLIATAILATGGVGLYLYKSPENESSDDREYDEKVDGDSDDAGFFGKGGFFSSSTGDAEEEEEEKEHIRYEPKPKTRSVKTKRNRRSGGTKRRY